MAESAAEIRSRIMSSVRSRDTQPEVILRRALYARGLRYRLHVKSLPGRPDVCFPRRRAVLLVNGCFWHRHERCNRATMPRSNVAFWAEKFSRNVARDRENLDGLLSAGWRVGVVWECWIGKGLNEQKIRELVEFVRDGGTMRTEWPLPGDRIGTNQTDATRDDGIGHRGLL